MLPRWLLLALLLTTTAHADPARFFVTGPGTFSIKNAKTGDRATIDYRRSDGTYDPDALKQLRRIMRSADGGERTPPLRLAELLARVFDMGGGDTLTLMSGYRSPTYNEGLRAKGRKAAGGSMHTEAMAADLAFARPKLKGLWLDVRALDCCGAGFYDKEGFVHVDVGQSRFWEATTSGVEKNLSAGNARLFARTEYDRYTKGETIRVTLHSLTVPPVRVARDARITLDDGTTVPVRFAAGEGADADCMEVDSNDAVLAARAPDRTVRGRLQLTTCAPRVEKTPESFDGNLLEIR